MTIHSSFQVIDYLATTGIFELVIMGPLPLEVPSFKSLWLPFDNTVWIMTILLIAESAFVLSLVDITWRKTITKRHRPAINDVFEGSRLHRYEVGSLLLITLFTLSAIWLISSCLLEGALSGIRIQKASFASRRILLIQWLGFCFLMTSAYS